MEIIDTVNPKGSNRWQVVALVVLGIVIIGLIVGIIVFSIRENSNDGGDSGGTLSQVSAEEKAAIMDSVDNYMENIEGEDEALAYLDKKIEQYEGTEAWLDLQLEKVNYLDEIGKYTEALELLDSFSDDKSLSSDNKIRLYALYVDLYDKTGNENKFEEFSKKYNEELSKRINGGVGFE